MKKNIILFALALLFTGSAFAAEKADNKASGKWTDHLKVYGFVRTYFAFDTRESHAGSDDFYYYLPKDVKLGSDGSDLMEYPSFRFAALTTRVGLDVKGFTFGAYSLGGKIEADFNAGLTGNTGTAQLRLRQAYASISRDGRVWKIGQAWHPMAADLPDIFSLESGAPFGPFNRSPQVNFDIVDSFDEWDVKMGVTAAALWQMQYTSVGPEGSSANYMKYSCIPEWYLGFNFLTPATTLRVGVDVLSTKPRKDDGFKKVSDRLTTVNAFAFVKQSIQDLTLKAKVTYTQDGSHMNMVGGYGVQEVLSNGSWIYTPTHTMSAWFTASYKYKNWQPQLFLGYLENMGTVAPVVGFIGGTSFWEKNNASKLNRAIRIQPEIIYNMGKLQFGLQYMMTMAQYGNSDAYKKPVENLHEVFNHRIQALVKFNF